MDWKTTLHNLDVVCAKVDISDAFRDAVRVKLVEKALMPIVNIEPTKVAYSTINSSCSSVRFKRSGVEFVWKHGPTSLLVRLQKCDKPFLVYQSLKGYNIQSFCTEKEAAEEVLRLLTQNKNKE